MEQMDEEEDKHLKSAVLDACVLFPGVPRDTFLRVTVEDLLEKKLKTHAPNFVKLVQQELRI